ncbi:hypothetical protein ACI1US_00642 [Leucobacter sp. BZR 635]
MSENHAPQDVREAGPAGTQLGASPEAAPGKKKLSVFLRVSIILLIGLTLASISLLFIGDFEGRFERVFSTFALFAVFVVLTAVDTSRERANEWYAPVALIANTYILGLLLVVIWMTPYDPFSLVLEIFWKSLLVIAVTRLVIVCCEVLLRLGDESDDAGNRFAFITSVLAVLSGILFTAPVGIEAFSLHIPDLYWKIATAVLILTALGLSVTLLLRWANGSDERARKRATAAGQAHTRATAAGQAHTRADAAAQAAAAQAAAASQASPQPAQLAQLNQQPAQLDQQLSQPIQPGQQAPQPLAPGAPIANADGVVLLPWPTFADGRPIPARPDGQPDFSVPGAPLPPQL